MTADALDVVLGALPGAVVLPRDYGPPDRVAAERPGRGLDPSRMTLRGPCPACGQETACGWVERAPGGGWREIRSDPTPCLDCRASAGGPVWAVRPRVVTTYDDDGYPDSARLEGGYAAPWWAARAGDWAAPQNAPCALGGPAPERSPGPAGATGHPPAAAAVLGPHSPGPLPAFLPPDVDPAAVVVLGRRAFADGRQVATLAPPTEERSS